MPKGSNIGWGWGDGKTLQDREKGWRPWSGVCAVTASEGTALEPQELEGGLPLPSLAVTEARSSLLYPVKLKSKRTFKPIRGDPCVYHLSRDPSGLAYLLCTIFMKLKEQARNFL